MNKMMYTYWSNGRKLTEPVVVICSYFRPGDGPRALVIGIDNEVFEASPHDLKLDAKEYNKVFAE